MVGHYWYNGNTNLNKKKFFEAIKHYKYIPLLVIISLVINQRYDVALSSSVLINYYQHFIIRKRDS